METVVSGADGGFEMTRVPAGPIQVVIDGRAATNAPEGVYFPQIVRDVVIAPGVENTLSRATGAAGPLRDPADRAEVYLPRLDEDILQALSSTETTEATAEASGAPDLTADQRAGIGLSVDAGAVLGHDGRPLEGGVVGIASIAPGLARDMLPEGELQRAFAFVVEAPGAAAFASPARLSLPNVFGAAPGAQVTLLRLIQPAAGSPWRASRP